MYKPVPPHKIGNLPRACTSAIAACAIGGITLSGGEGTALGAFLGILFLGIIRNGLNIIGVESFYQYLVNGVIIIIAVVLSNYSSKRRG